VWGIEVLLLVVKTQVVKTLRYMHPGLGYRSFTTSSKDTSSKGTSSKDTKVYASRSGV